ncbi:hypothetical protein BDV19DRAFT_372842 [Aspergillus venezuelensis]
MSFLKSLTKEFKELKASLTDDKDKEKEEKHSEGDSHRGYDPNYGAPPNSDPYSQGGYPPQPPQPQYNHNPSGGPPLPPGWTAQFDQASGRWYYIEQATGISRWEPPAHTAPYGQYGAPQVPQYGGAYPAHGGDPYAQGQSYNPNPYPAHGPPPGAGYGDYSQGHGGYGGYEGERSGEYKDKEKDDKKKMMMAGAGGLAVGAVGGALIGHALADDSDEERAAAAAGAPSATAPPPMGLPPDETADGDSVSQSDRESVLEAQQEYQEAQLAAQDSDASSSEEEALEEAREEYEEVYEETYDD